MQEKDTALHFAIAEQRSFADNMTRDNIIAYDSDTEGWEWGKSVQRILIEVVKTSLERGADIFAKDNAERTVLDFAMAYDESKIIPTLGDQSGFRLQV